VREKCNAYGATSLTDLRNEFDVPKIIEEVIQYEVEPTPPGAYKYHWKKDKVNDFWNLMNPYRAVNRGDSSLRFSRVFPPRSRSVARPMIMPLVF
jgi:hypothetical protein